MQNELGKIVEYVSLLLPVFCVIRCSLTRRLYSTASLLPCSPTRIHGPGSLPVNACMSLKILLLYKVTLFYLGDNSVPISRFVRMFMLGADTNFSYTTGDNSGGISSAALRSSHTSSGRSRTKVMLSRQTALLWIVTYLLRRVHSHAAATLINFCKGVERDTLLPYLDPIVECLLKLLNAAGDPANATSLLPLPLISTSSHNSSMPSCSPRSSSNTARTVSICRSITSSDIPQKLYRCSPSNPLHLLHCHLPAHEPLTR